MKANRSPSELITVSEEPFNAETPLTELLNDVTNSDLVYVRNHFDVPRLNADSWALEVSGLVNSPSTFALADLMELPSQALKVTMECAGNGRKSMDPTPSGTAWGYGAVSIVEFGGTPLAEVLNLVEIVDGAQNVVFYGADTGEVTPGRREVFARSLPMEAALDPSTLLAWDMNSQPLTPNHGFPIRLVVPNWYGMASVKWLTRIQLTADAFTGFFQNEHYIYSEEDGTPEGEPVRLMRVRSLILDIRSEDGSGFEVSGIAWSGEGAISKVEVSTNDGSEWRTADLDPPASEFGVQRWRLSSRAALNPEDTIMARATDSVGNVQPQSGRWNRGGYGNNGVHVTSLQPRSAASS